MRGYELNDEQWGSSLHCYPLPRQAVPGAVTARPSTASSGALLRCRLARRPGALRALPHRLRPLREVPRRWHPGSHPVGAAPEARRRRTRRLDDLNDRWYFHSRLPRRSRSAKKEVMRHAVVSRRAGARAKPRRHDDKAPSHLRRKRLAAAVHVTAGQRSESAQFETVCSLVRAPPRPKRLIADRGYDARRIRAWLRERQIRAVIPERKRAAGKKRRRRGRVHLC